MRPYRPGLPGIRAASGIHVTSQVAAMAEIPSLLTKAFAWIRVHPDEISEAMEQRARQIADQFGKKFKAEEEEEEGQGNDDSDSSPNKKKKKKDKEKKKKKKKKGKGATAASTAFKILNGLSKPGTCPSFYSSISTHVACQNLVLNHIPVLTVVKILNGLSRPGTYPPFYSSISVMYCLSEPCF